MRQPQMQAFLVSAVGLCMSECIQYAEGAGLARPAPKPSLASAVHVRGVGLQERVRPADHQAVL